MVTASVCFQVPSCMGTLAEIKVHQQFASDWMRELFTPRYRKSNGKPTVKQ